MKIIDEIQLDFDDVSIQPKRSSLNSRSEIDLYRTYKWKSDMFSHELICKPLCCANMGTVGTPKMAKELVSRGYLCALEKHIPYEDIVKLYTELIDKANDEDCPTQTYFTDRIAISIGVKEPTDILKKLNEKFKVNIVNLDVPNGYIPKVMDRIREIREILPECFLIVGTVVTADIVTDLIMRGANCVRLGICNGSVCRTADKTGVRRPIVSMLLECADAAHQLNGYVMLDGGLRCPADWCKALVAGADICMSGSIFAGTDFAEGDLIEKHYFTNEVDAMGHRVIKTKYFKQYYGMASDYAQEKHFDGVKAYKTSEGRQKLIPYTGELDEVLRDYEGGLKSMMCYIGARQIKHIQRHGTFYKVNHQINDVFASCEDF